MYPSLFNDVFGPIMIGPSSSACAGPTRIGQIARGISGGTPSYYRICYVPNSGRASFREGMATNLGLIAGVLGWDTEDPRLYAAQEIAEAGGMKIEVALEEIPGNTNPNAILLTMRNQDGETSTLLGDSIGGGTIAILEIDGYPVEGIKGEEYVLVLEHRKPGIEKDVLAILQQDLPEIYDGILHVEHSANPQLPEQEMLLIFLERGEFNLQPFRGLPGVSKVFLINPIMPIVTRKDAKPPLFRSVKELVDLAISENVDCSEIAIRYEMGRSMKSREEVVAMMAHIWEVIKNTVEKGKSCTVEHMRGPGHPLFAARMKARIEKGENITDSLMTEMLATALYSHEGKNDKNTLSVAGPAAGCPPIMSGALLPLANKLGLKDEDIVHALFTAAAIGAVTYMHTVPTGEITGCSGEVGVGSAMAAGAIVTLVGGDPKCVDSAAAIALMNMFGLPCDPIAGGGCAMPCRGRSHTAPLNSLASAELALSGFDAVVPYDQVVLALDELYKKLPGCMKGSLDAGIPATPAALEESEKYKAWLKKSYE